MDIVRSQPEGLVLLASAHSSDVYKRISEPVTVILERFARAITRMWTLGAVHEEGRRYTGIINNFLFLRRSRPRNLTPSSYPVEPS